MSVNLKDVAQRAGVSESKWPPRNSITSPTVQAQGLLGSATGMIGVLAGDVGDPYFSEMINGIKDVAFQRRLLVAICQTQRDIEQELAYFKMLQATGLRQVIEVAGGRRTPRCCHP